MLPLFYEYEAVAGDTLASVASAFGVSENAVYLSNTAVLAGREVPAGAILRVPAVEGVLHTMELGETLREIAEYWGVEVETIVAFAANGLSSPSDSRAGALILVPLPPGALEPPPPGLTPTPVAPLPPAPVEPMTIEVVTDDPAVRENVGALTVVVGCVDCGTVDLDEAAGTTFVLEVGAVPGACIAPGATITFVDANGRTLFEKTVFESGGHFLLTNLAPEPPF